MVATTYNLGMAIEVDLTPAWWSMDDFRTVYRAVLEALLESESDIAHSKDFTIGINGVTVRLCWSVDMGPVDLAEWRERMAERIAARPELQAIQALHERHKLERRVQRGDTVATVLYHASEYLNARVSDLHVLVTSDGRFTLVARSGFGTTAAMDLQEYVCQFLPAVASLSVDVLAPASWPPHGAGSVTVERKGDLAA